MASERRAKPRRKIDTPQPLDLLGPDGCLLGMAVPEDVSAAGICLLVRTAYAIGAVLAVAAARGRAHGRLAFRVNRCEVFDGGYLIAGPFLRPIPESDLRALAQE